MSRSLALAVAFLVAVVAAVAIILPIFLLSWRFAVSAEETALNEAADGMLKRAEAIYASATATLRGIDMTGLEPCGPEHTLLMSRATIEDLFIDNVAYVADGYVRCNGYGPVETRILADEVDVVQPDGIALNVNWVARTLPPRPTLVVKVGPHRGLIDQRNFYDGFFAPETEQYLTLRTLNQIPLAAGRDDGSAILREHHADDYRADVKSTNWIVSIDAPSLGFLAYLRSVATIVIPLAVALVLLIGGAVLWHLLRPISGKTLIEQALRRRQFIVHYQPIIDLATQRCVAAEALIRLRRPDGVLLRPDLFIPYAEETDLIHRLTAHVTDSVVREMGPALRSDRSFHVSINVSAADIVTGRILGTLERALKGSGIAPQQIWLEMTERAFINIDGARPTLEELIRRGHCVAIDDFGTGYSGLQYLAKLPVEMLKIDKSFIETVGTAAPTSRVTDQIIAMARELKLALVAEGVETESQATFLRNERVEYAQGWLFSRALPAGDFLAFLRHDHATADLPEGAAPAGAA